MANARHGHRSHLHHVRGRAGERVVGRTQRLCGRSAGAADVGGSPRAAAPRAQAHAAVGAHIGHPRAAVLDDKDEAALEGGALHDPLARGSLRDGSGDADLQAGAAAAAAAGRSNNTSWQRRHGGNAEA